MALPLVGMLMFACLSAKSDQGQRFLPLATFGGERIVGWLPAAIQPPGPGSAIVAAVSHEGERLRSGAKPPCDQIKSDQSKTTPEGVVRTTPLASLAGRGGRG